MTEAVGLVEGDRGGLDGDPAGVADGVAGVDAQVDEDLVDLGRIDAHRRQPPGRQPGEVDVLADEPPDHLEHAGHGGVQVEHPRRRGLPAGKGKQLLGEVGGALHRLADGLQPAGERSGVAGRVQRQFRVAEDDAEHVVEIVRHPAGQAADGLHLLGLDELLLQGLAVADVQVDEDRPVDVATVVAHRRRIGEDGLAGAVRRLDLEQFIGHRDAALQGARQGALFRRHRFPAGQAAGREGAQAVARGRPAAPDGPAGRVAAQQGAVPVGDPQADGQDLDHLLQLFLPPPQFLLGAPPLGDVDTVAGEQLPLPEGDGELDGGVGTPVQFLLQLQDLTPLHHPPVVGDDPVGELGREQLVHGPPDHGRARDADHVAVVLAGAQRPALVRLDLLDKGIDGRMVDEQGEQLVARPQVLLRLLEPGDIGVGAEQQQRSAGRVAGEQAAPGKDPHPAAVPVAQPELDVVIRAVAVDTALQGPAGRLQVVRVHQFGPGVETAGFQFGQGAAELPGPGLVDHESAGLHVPFPGAQP